MATQVATLVIAEGARTFTFWPEGDVRQFETINQLEEFVDSEISFWAAVDNSIESKYKAVKVDIANLRKQHTDGDVEEEELKTVKKNLCNGQWSDNIGIGTCVASNSKVGRYLKELHDEDPPNYKRRSLVVAKLLWFPYVQDAVFATNRKTILDLFKAYSSFKLDDNLGGVIKTYRDQLNDLAGQKHNNQVVFDSKVEEVARLMNTLDEREKQLEITYTEKLKLDAPAQYWETLAQSYSWRGALCFGIVFLLGFCIFLYYYKMLTDFDWVPLFNYERMNLPAIRGCLILIVMTSVAGYLLHVFTKLAMSSFHLARDYRERFQLTRVYLALMKSGDIKGDQQSKTIVMQSLFSRSDTGLLKGDNAMKLPSVSDLLGKGE